MGPAVLQSPRQKAGLDAPWGSNLVCQKPCQSSERSPSLSAGPCCIHLWLQGTSTPLALRTHSTPKTLLSLSSPCLLIPFCLFLFPLGCHLDLHGGLPSLPLSSPSPSSFMSPGEPALSELKVEGTPSKCGNKHRTNSQQKPARSSTPRSLKGRSLKKALDPVTHCLHEGQEVMCPFYRCNK